MNENFNQKPSAAFSFTVRLQIENKPGNFSKVVQRLAGLSASLAEVSLVTSNFKYNVRDVTIHCSSESHQKEVLAALESIIHLNILACSDDTYRMHQGGKLVVAPKTQLGTLDDLSRAYTPGVARICNAIAENKERAYQLTIKKNTVAVVTDGSAVLGLGDIGPHAALPVMEGKALLFKQFAEIDAFPICLDTKDTEEIISIVKSLSPVFGGINLEDISAPRCFEIEERLQAELDIPVFHDDQHGTAVVVLAALINSMKITGKKLKDLSVVINGFGAGGVACTRLLVEAGVKNIVACDSVGIVYKGRKQQMNPVKESLLPMINLDNKKGTVADALIGADVFIGVSKPGVVSKNDISLMAANSIVFALANPTPEIMPAEITGIARIIATGRSDYANQVNNVLCFPGIFKGALKCHARSITMGMKLAAAQAIAAAVSDADLSPEMIIPSAFNLEVSGIVAERVAEAAHRDGVARKMEEHGFYLDADPRSN
jgi:malate dehydrogenase (oxaloacetate-decarboxylating)